MTTKVMILTPREAAQRVKVSEQTIRRLCRNGSLRCRKVGKQWRIASADLLRFYEAK